jgi:hypothetical protein
MWYCPVGRGHVTCEEGWKRICAARLLGLYPSAWLEFLEADDYLDGFPVDAVMFQLTVPASSGKPTE